MRPRLVARLSFLCLTSLLAVACGGGGGGGGGGTPDGSGGGKGFKVTAGPGGGTIGGLNFPVTLQFNKAVDPATVSPASIQVVTVNDPAGQASTPGGILASVTFVVDGKTVRLEPDIEFDVDKVIFGFKADALYEIAFSDAGPGAVLESTGGEALGNTGTSYFFRTPETGFDFNPGYPMARAFLVTDPASVVLPDVIADADEDNDVVEDALDLFSGETEIVQTNPAMVLPVTPVQEVLFFFDDALLPPSVINALDSSSPAIKVSINTAPLPQFLPKTLTAQYTFLHQQDDLTIVRWQPKFEAWTPGAFVFVQVAGTVQDLAGNTKELLSGSGAPDVFVTLRVAGTPDPTVYSLFEPFDDDTQEDISATSAEWAGDFPGQLGPVLGGGTGDDGPFLIDPVGTAQEPGDTTVPTGALVDYDAQVVSLPVVEEVVIGVFEPRTYQFTELSLPAGWTLDVLSDRDGDGQPDPDEFLVQSPGHPLDGLGAPLVILCSGDIHLDGVLDARGVAGEVYVRPEGPADTGYAAYLGQGATGAAALQAAGDGGDGGDVLLLASGGGIAFDLVSPPAVPAFDAADPKLRGATGRSTALAPTSLTDSNSLLSSLDNDPATAIVGDPELLAAIAAGELLLQPNLGVGSSLQGNAGTANQDIDENHPTFVVEQVSVDGAGTRFEVSSDPGDPTLTQASDNIGAAPVASAGDCYLVGRLRGLSGGDASLLGRGGQGAEPYVVVNEGALGITTTGGGGGGGGSYGPGADGLSDGPASNPLVNQRGGSGGISLDESPGASGGQAAIRGTGQVLNDTQIEVLTQTAGADLAGLGGGALVGSVLIPNASADGWLFEVTAFVDPTLSIERIQLDMVDIGLLDGPGADGPALQVGSTYDFVLLPPLEIGGAGGGGSGVSVTGTVANTASVLPVLAPGAGGGAGGASLTLETARTLRIGPTASIVADGGAGGTVFDVQTQFAGGGGGGGGNVLLRAGRQLELLQGAGISLVGGAGGGVAGTGQGGAGGDGFLRMENFDDTITVADLAGFTQPAAAELNVGRQLGQPQGVGQSVFYEALVVNPEWDQVVIGYVADTDQDDVAESFAWSFLDSGPDGGVAGKLDPPVRVVFDTTGVNDDGFFDGTDVDTSFYPPCDLVSGRAGLAHDAATDVVLYAPGEDCTRIHRLDPATLAPTVNGSAFIPLPLIPDSGTSLLDVVSLAVDSTGGELFLLERRTRRVHVLDLTTGDYLRRIQLPLDLQGPMAYDPAGDLLVLADNLGERVATFEPRDALATDPGTTDWAPLAPLDQFPLSRDGVTLPLHLVGLALDSAGSTLWCADGMAGTLFQVSYAPGSQGESLTGVHGFSQLTSGGAGVVPSAVAYDGSSLFLVHATDPADSRVQAIDPASVSLAGADLALAAFGTTLPEPVRSIADGDKFLRFRLVLDGTYDASDGTAFRGVRVESIEFVYENKAF